MVALVYQRTNQHPLIPTSGIPLGTGYIAARGMELLDRIMGGPNRVSGVVLNSLDPLCTAPGLPDYQLRLPATLLYDGVPPGTLTGPPQDLFLGLWILQRKAARAHGVP